MYSHYFVLYLVTPSPPLNVGIAVGKLLNGSIEVTCPDESLNCLVLVQSTTDNPDQVHVGLINSDDDRTVVLSPGATDVSVVVYTWNNTESIFSGQLSHVSQPVGEFLLDCEVFRLYFTWR